MFKLVASVLVLIVLVVCAVVFGDLDFTGSLSVGVSSSEEVSAPAPASNDETNFKSLKIE